jgi:hypothetical protein
MYITISIITVIFINIYVGFFLFNNVIYDFYFMTVCLYV